MASIVVTDRVSLNLEPTEGPPEQPVVQLPADHGSHTLAAADAAKSSEQLLDRPREAQCTPVMELAAVNSASAPMAGKQDDLDAVTNLSPSSVSPSDITSDGAPPLLGGDQRTPVAPPRRRKQKVDTIAAVASTSQVDDTALTDEQILNTVTIKCLDTGETVPLSKAQDLLPEGLNPLALTVIQRAGEFSSDHGTPYKDGDTAALSSTSDMNGGGKQRLTKFLTRVKGRAAEKMRRLADNVADAVEDRKGRTDEREHVEEAAGFVKVSFDLSMALEHTLPCSIFSVLTFFFTFALGWAQMSTRLKEVHLLRRLRVIQDLRGEHKVWTSQFQFVFLPLTGVCKSVAPSNNVNFLMR